MNNLYLEHHGIKGQKWGVRRYQNPDGSYTAAGRDRYGVGEAKQKLKNAKTAYNKSFNNAYNKAIAAYSPFKKHREANQKRWEDVYDKAGDVRKAKEDYKTAKRQTKLDNYRLKKADRAERREQYNKAEASRTRKELKDLKENKYNSEYYKRREEARQLEKEFEYEQRTGKSYNADMRAWDQLGRSFESTASKNMKLNTYVEDLTKENKEYTNKARKWAKSRENLLNMEINELTTKKDIKNAYKNKRG